MSENRVEVVEDDEIGKGGYAVIRVYDVEARPQDVGFRIGYRYTNEWLGPDGYWRRSTILVQPREWRHQDGLLELFIGPEIVNSISANQPVRIEVPSVDAGQVLLWPSLPPGEVDELASQEGAPAEPVVVAPAAGKATISKPAQPANAAAAQAAEPSKPTPPVRKPEPAKPAAPATQSPSPRAAAEPKPAASDSSEIDAFFEGLRQDADASNKARRAKGAAPKKAASQKVARVDEPKPAPAPRRAGFPWAAAGSAAVVSGLAVWLLAANFAAQPKPPEGSAAQLQALLDTKTQEYEALSSQFTTLQTQNQDELIKRDNVVAALEQEKATLAAELASRSGAVAFSSSGGNGGASASHVALLESQRDQARKERDEARAQLSASSQSGGTGGGTPRIAALTAERDAAREEGNVLRAQIAHLQQQRGGASEERAEQLEADLATANSRAQELEGQVRKAIEDRDAVRKLVETISPERDAAVKALAEVERSRDEIAAQLAAAQSQLQSTNTIVRAAEGERDSARADVAKMASRVAELQNKLNIAEKAVADVRASGSAGDARAQELAGELKLAVAERDKLRAAIATTISERDRAQQQSAELVGRLAELEDQVASGGGRSAGGSSAALEAALTARDAAQAELAELKEMIADSDETAQQAASLRAELAEARTERNALRREVESLRSAAPAAAAAASATVATAASSEQSARPAAAAAEGGSIPAETLETALNAIQRDFGLGIIQSDKLRRALSSGQRVGQAVESVLGVSDTRVNGLTKALCSALPGNC